MPNGQLWTCFCYDICQQTEVCANVLYRVRSQSLVVQHAVVQICLTMNGALHEHIHILHKGKGKVHPRTRHEGRKGERKYCSTLPAPLVADGGGWPMPCPSRFTPGIGGWLGTGSVWTDAQNLAPTGIQSLDHATHRKLVCLLLYPSPPLYIKGSLKFKFLNLSPKD